MWLMLTLPGADDLVGEWRRRHDPYAGFGVPAHTTVRKPFLPPERWSDLPSDLLESLLPVEVTLTRVEGRPGTLVVVIEPDGLLRERTREISAVLRELPPHKDDRPDLAYHVTVVRTPDPGVRTEAAGDIGRHLPLQVTGTELWAGATTPDGYTHADLATARGDHPW